MILRPTIPLVRRRAVACAALVMIAAALPTGCLANDVPDAGSRLERLDAAVAAAARFLVGRQSADGLWRSDVYGPFREGDALTPLVLHSLLDLPEGLRPQAAGRKAAARLAAMIRADGTIDAGPHGLTYPVYTAAGAIVALSQPVHTEHRTARDAWLKYLRERQLTEPLGWRPDDPAYGGWGYATGLPRRPAEGEPMSPLSEPNLSATLFAIEALRAAGCAADDPALVKALMFVRRCQNHADDFDEADAAFDDGGFFFIQGDAVRNKAGIAGRDGRGRERFRSYGSTTADGLRALLACGMPPDAPRVVAARRWLKRHFAAADHPGRYVADRESARPGLDYYYAASVAAAFRACGLTEFRASVEQRGQAPAAENAVEQSKSATAAGACPLGSTGSVRWAEVLADALLDRQRPDGSWSNPAVAVREDDPLVATPLALTALLACRSVLLSAFQHGPPAGR